MNLEESPHHPILDRPWEYEVVGFNFQRSLILETEPYIDLTLQSGSAVRRLRFYGPKDIQIESGFPEWTGGLVILDVTSRGMEGIGIRVDDFEASRGSVTFWARTVVDLDSSPNGSNE